MTRRFPIPRAIRQQLRWLRTLFFPNRSTVKGGHRHG